MRTLAAVLALVFVLGSVPAQAGWWIFGRDNKGTSMKKRLPKAIDHPVLRPKAQETHKAGKRAGDHPEHTGQIR